MDGKMIDYGFEQPILRVCDLLKTSGSGAFDKILALIMSSA